MNLIPIAKSFLKQSGKFVTKHSPTILTILGSGGVITSVIFGVKATPKAMKLIEKRKGELGVEQLSKVETIKTCWPVYIPAAGMTAASIGCFVGANSINLHRNAALASLYATTEHTLREYQQTVVDTIGEAAEKDIHEKAAEKLVNGGILDGKDEPKLLEGDELCYDEYSGQTFRSDRAKLKTVEADILTEMATGQMYVSCTDVYDAMGMTPPLFAEGLGWTIDDKFRINVKAIYGENGRLCNYVTFSVPPHTNYYSMF